MTWLMYDDYNDVVVPNPRIEPQQIEYQDLVTVGSGRIPNVVWLSGHFSPEFGGSVPAVSRHG